MWEKDIPVDKEQRARYYFFIISSSIQGYLHTQDFRGTSRYKPQLLKEQSVNEA